MGTKRLTRVNELLKRAVADVLFRSLATEQVDLSAVTVTHVITSSDLRRARVLVSVRGSSDEQKDALATLYRHRKDIQRKVGDDVTLKYTPRLTFQLDDSLEEGDHVLDIISQIEADHPDWTDEDERTPEQE